MDFERYSLSAAGACEQETMEIYKTAVKTLIERGLTVATAESCTGGLIGKLFTDVSGASATLAGGMITYSLSFFCTLVCESSLCKNYLAGTKGEHLFCLDIFRHLVQAKN